MKKRTRTVSALALATTIALPLGAGLQASSHREAPFLTEMPKVDATDLYMFRSYETGRQDFVTFIADYVPFQDPFAGPNYYMMDPDALYEIHVDNNGDAKEDLTFQFRFKNELAAGGKGLAVKSGDKMTEVPLTNIGGITAADRSALNVKESYTVQVVRNGRRSGSAMDVVNATGDAKEFLKPTDYIGTKTFGPAPGYENYAKAHQYNIKVPGCAAAGRMFVGQRKEPFAVNIGPIFDLVNAPAEIITGTKGRDLAPNPLAGKNITTIALELPIACVKADGKDVIGSWTTSSVRQIRLLDPKPNYARPALEVGAWTQVSRLSNPLVNEVVIGLKDKNLFNASEPSGDGQFAGYVTNPSLAELLQILFGGAGDISPNKFPRADLVAAFLTGVEGVNKNGSTAEMQRLNVAIAPKAKGMQNSLGALECFAPGGVLKLDNAGCDPAGFPNGRRPGDDIVDIELRVMMGALLPVADAPAAAVPFTDGVLQEASQFDEAFPYLKTPMPGAM